MNMGSFGGHYQVGMNMGSFGGHYKKHDSSVLHLDPIGMFIVLREL